MAQLPYSNILVGPATFNVTPQMRFVNFSMKGASAVASQILTTNSIITLPAPGTINLANGQVIGASDNSGGFVQGIRITVPAGGAVEIWGEVG